MAYENFVPEGMKFDYCLKFNSILHRGQKLHNFFFKFKLSKKKVSKNFTKITNFITKLKFAF